MKNLFIIRSFFPVGSSLLASLIASLLATLLYSCGDISNSSYTLVLPPAPKAWIAALGEPHWKLEWLDSGGQIQTANIAPQSKTVINLPVTWVNPVTALPFWPERNIPPGLFKPAGALFPFDVSDQRINLSWEAGPDTVFYWELAWNSKDAARLPANFDWIRFRELFETEVLSVEVCKDPWLVDWRFVAERTIESSFDRRRLTAQTAQAVPVPLSNEHAVLHWYGNSPFATPLSFSEKETPVFPVLPGINTWISEAGILKISGNTWILTKW